MMPKDVGQCVVSALTRHIAEHIVIVTIDLNMMAMKFFYTKNQTVRGAEADAEMGDKYS